MNRQTNFAILAIAVIIPISGLFVWNTDQSLVSASSNTTELSVIASFYPLYEFTKQVGQDKIKVSLLVPPGIEPHDWDPTISELQKLHESDLIVINGFGFESWIDDIDSENTGINIVDTSIGIKTVDNEILENDSEHDEHLVADPHIWLNPIMAKIQVTNIANALSEIDSSNENFYQQNAKSYIAKLDSLDVKIKNELKGCKKDFIAFHNAFLYFAIQYNLNQHTIINSNEPYSEATSKKLEEIINLAQYYNIDVIFSEEAIDSRSAEVIANEIGAKVLVLSPIEVLDDNSSYLTKMENNLSNLKEALCN